MHLILPLHVRHSMPVRKLRLGRLRLWPTTAVSAWLPLAALRTLPEIQCTKTTLKIHHQQPLLWGTAVLILHRLAARHHALFCSALNFMLQSNQLYAPSLSHETRRAKAGMCKGEWRDEEKQRRWERWEVEGRWRIYGVGGVQEEIHGSGQERNKLKMTEMERWNTTVTEGWRGILKQLNNQKHLSY